MPAVLNTNVASLWASKNLLGAQNKMADSVERLSSGLRINRARDDAAGLGPQLRESTLESIPAHREVIVERVVSQRVDYLQQLRLGHTDRGQPP
jgi:hypothetical protein